MLATSRKTFQGEKLGRASEVYCNGSVVTLESPRTTREKLDNETDEKATN